jgi:hypothetical protein
MHEDSSFLQEARLAKKERVVTELMLAITALTDQARALCSDAFMRAAAPRECDVLCGYHHTSTAQAEAEAEAMGTGETRLCSLVSERDKTRETRQTSSEPANAGLVHAAASCSAIQQGHTSAQPAHALGKAEAETRETKDGRVRGDGCLVQASTETWLPDAMSPSRDAAIIGSSYAQEEGEEVGESKGLEGSWLPDEVRRLLRRMLAAQNLLLLCMQRMRDDANERQKEGMLLRKEQEEEERKRQEEDEETKRKEEEAKSAEASPFSSSQEASASILTRHQTTLISGTFAAASFLNAKAGKSQDIEAGATVLKATPKRSFADVWSSLLSQSLSLSLSLALFRASALYLSLSLARALSPSLTVISLLSLALLLSA